MSTFLDDLLMKMKTAPHVGVPSVTNPKLPTKVERDTAEYAARQKALPNFKFGTGTPLEKLKARMANAPHPTPICADPNFHKFEMFDTQCVLTKAELDAFDTKYNAFRTKMREARAKRKKKEVNSMTAQTESEADKE